MRPLVREDVTRSRGRGSRSSPPARLLQPARTVDLPAQPLGRRILDLGAPAAKRQGATSSAGRGMRSLGRGRVGIFRTLQIRGCPSEHPRMSLQFHCLCHSLRHAGGSSSTLCSRNLRLLSVAIFPRPIITHQEGVEGWPVKKPGKPLGNSSRKVPTPARFVGKAGSCWEESSPGTLRPLKPRRRFFRRRGKMGSSIARARSAGRISDRTTANVCRASASGRSRSPTDSRTSTPARARRKVQAGSRGTGATQDFLRSTADPVTRWKPGLTPMIRRRPARDRLGLAEPGQERPPRTPPTPSRTAWSRVASPRPRRSASRRVPALRPENWRRSRAHSEAAGS